MAQTKTRNTIGHLLYALLVAVLLWIAISTIIQAFKYPELSQTELFLRIPKSVVGKWQTK